MTSDCGDGALFAVVGAGVCADPVAQTGSVAAAKPARPTSPNVDSWREARPFIIITSLLSRARRLRARTPSTAAMGDAGASGAVTIDDKASNDSAYARRPFGSAATTQPSHASS